jgi:hypothetical protein
MQRHHCYRDPVQMKIEGAAAEETSHDAGPVKMMTVREVSAYLRVHPSIIYSTN